MVNVIIYISIINIGVIKYIENNDLFSSAYPIVLSFPVFSNINAGSKKYNNVNIIM